MSFGDRRRLEEGLKGISAVLHLAASKKGSEAVQVANTIVVTQQVLEACTTIGVQRVVLVSSFGVFHTASLSRGGLVDERTPLEPYPERRDPYSFTKRRQEELAWEICGERGLPLVVIRPGVIFGPGDPILTSRVGLELFGLFLDLGGGNSIPLTYVKNCADAVVLAAETAGVEGEAFCIVDDSLPTSRELLSRYRRQVRAIPTVRVPYHLLRAVSRLNEICSGWTGGRLPEIFTPYNVDTMWKGHTFSNEKAKRLLGWEPSISMEEALKITFAAQSR